MDLEIVELLAIAGFLAVVANRLIDGLITPLYEKFGWDKFSLKYVAWVLAGFMVWASGINLFKDFIPNPVIGLILSALVAGGGANMLHDWLVPGAPEPPEY